MRVLHLFGDWKWTGPAEPTLDLCIELRALGVDVTLACQPAPPEAGTTNLPAKARERGFEPEHTFVFNKILNLRDNFADIARLRERCVTGGIDIVHVHHTHDHIVASFGMKSPAKLVRTNHRATQLPWLLRDRMDGYLTFTREDDLLGRLPIPHRHVAPGMRLDRFDPAALHEDMRAHFRVPAGAFVIGVVARMQRHRRFDVLLEGLRIARERVPDLRVLIVGRGTNRDEVAVQPAGRLGLDDVVTFTGYLGPQYLATVAAFDALLFLVPGSDGTCRALREAMAMGRAAIGARRGMIPEIVDDGRTGILIEDTPETIAGAIERLARDRFMCAEMGARAREKALAAYDLRTQAQDVLDFYHELLGTKGNA
jgi:L-malate glycosyltransferase